MILRIRYNAQNTHPRKKTKLYLPIGCFSEEIQESRIRENLFQNQRSLRSGRRLNFCYKMKNNFLFILIFFNFPFLFHFLISILYNL